MPEISPEELARQEADKVAREAADKVAADLRAKELESIPEPLRGKSQKELVDMLLTTNLDTEKLRTEAERAKALDLELEKYKPRSQELTPDQRKAQAVNRILDDPEAFIRDIQQQSLKPITETYYMDKATQAEEWAKKTLEDFPKYEKDIKKAMEGLSPDLKASPKVWEAVHKVVAYDSLRKELQEVKAKSGMFTEGAGSPPEGEGGTKVRHLSDEEKRVAAKFGLDDKSFMEWSEAKGGM
jgi:hypothetical protein